jgi:hypothetical protein
MPIQKNKKIEILLPIFRMTWYDAISVAASARERSSAGGTPPEAERTQRDNG